MGDRGRRAAADSGVVELALRTRPEKSDGLYVGEDADARIAPVCGSIATIAPPSAAHWPLLCASWIPYASAFCAACWRPESSVSERSAPAWRP